jgi:hypothetical protein
MVKERDSQIEKIVNKISEDNMEKSMAIRGRIDSKVSDITKSHQQQLQDYKKENLILRNKTELYAKNLCDTESKTTKLDLKISSFETELSDRNQTINHLLAQVTSTSAEITR